jgi:diguanylate cyclase (GGDEF)-like protein/PAS domain S-box-containing protein
VIYALVLSAATSLLVGLALLLAWRRDPAQDFSRDLGVAYLFQAAAPFGFMLWTGHTGPLRVLGVVVMITAGVAYLCALLLGCARLAGRRASWAQAAALFALLLLAHGALVMVNVAWPPVLAATLHLVVGAVATAWLWPRGVAERLAGGGLVLVGLGQFTTVVGGLDWAAAQATGVAMLRLAVGLCLLFAALQRSATRARLAHERFVNLTERSHQGVGIQRGEDVLYMNPAARRIYGVDTSNAASAASTRWREATIPADERAAARERHRALIAGELPRAEWEADRQRIDGTPLRLRFSSWRVDWDGAPAEQIVVSDITAEHNALQERLHQATHDSLTGAPNRSALLQRLHQLTPAGKPFALLLLDIDRFALINDAHGPSVGDEVLRELARRLTRQFAGQAELMRLGEDEFALLTEGAEPRRVAALLSSGLRALLAQPLPAAGLAFYLDVSMGIALHPDTAADPERLLRAANAAMHQAKGVPGTSEQLAEDRFDRGSGASLAAEQALRAGIERQEFFLVYQPKLRASDRRLVGFEALLRWQRGSTLVAPADFIPAAERTGLIGPLGRQVLTLACRQITAWRAAGLQVLPVAVNVSRWQLVDPGFVGLVLGTLQEHGVAPQDLALEITETAAVQDPELVRERTEALRAAGMALALDDFGSGLSSLTSLRALPLQELKIDRGLIAPLPAADACAVVRAVCTLAAALRLRVVAEGVETEAQAAALQDCGCDVLQGYRFARPLAPALAAAWLQAGAQPVAA